MIDEAQYLQTQSDLINFAGVVLAMPLESFMEMAAEVGLKIGRPQAISMLNPQPADVRKLAEALVAFKTEVMRQVNSRTHGDSV